MGKDCAYCGAYISDSVDACPACGKKVKAERRPEAETYQSVRGAAAAQAQAERETKRESVEDGGEKYTYTYKQEYERRYGQEKARAAQSGGAQKSAGVSAEDEDVRANKTICYLCYLGPLFLIPYLTRRESDFVRYHSNQGLLLLLVSVVCQSLLGGLLSAVGGLFVLYGLIQGLSNVNKGIKKPLPFVGEIQLLK